MKKFTYIIAALFVVAIGVGIFISCEKESINENTLTSNSNKIQKDGELDQTYTIDDYTLVKGETEANYHWYNPEIPDPVPEVCAIDKGPGIREAVFSATEGSFTIICPDGGTTCGIAKEYNDSNKLIKEGIWAVDDAGWEWLCLRPVP
jgi:hypothetical protein